MRDVDLVNLNERGILDNAGDRVPIGLLSIASSMRAKGHQTKVYDLNRFPEEAFIEQVEYNKPDAVGISVYTSPMLEKAKELSYRLRGKTKLIAGGYHATAMPESLLPYFDAVVVGEGENSLEKALYTNGIIERDIPDLNKTPNVNLNELGEYSINGRQGTIITSRGCPYSCIEENQQLMLFSKPNIKMKNAKIGDKLMGLNEKTNSLEETKIIAVRDKQKQIFEIELENGRTIQATEEHPFKTKRGWIKLKNLKTNDEILFINPLEKNKIRMKNNNPMKDKKVINKMISTSKRKGHYITASHRLTQLHKDKKILYNTSKQISNRRMSKNLKEKNGMYNINCKYRNFYNLKLKIIRKEIKKCCICSSKRFLLVHHKDKNHENDKLNNLQVICKSCHAKVHNIITNIK